MTSASAMALMWLCASLHPEADIRAAARDEITSLSNGHGQGVAHDAVEATVRSTTGTELEPFVVTPEDVATTVELAVLALREPHASLQIVSRDKLRPDGGLLITLSAERELEARYLERFRPNVSPAPDPWTTWRFSPGHLPLPGQLGAHLPAVAATVSATETGFTFAIGPLTGEWQAAHTQLASQAKLVATGDQLDRLGFKVIASRDGTATWLQIRGGTAEGLIRMSAAMAGREWLLVGLPGTGSWLEAVAMRLDLPSAEPKLDLSVVRVLGDVALQRIDDWLHLPPNMKIGSVPKRVRLAMEDWIGVPREWAAPPYLEDRP